VRGVQERVADVQRLVDAARAVYDERSRYALRIARSTGLSFEGVQLGFDCLERDATPDDLNALVASAGDAESVHVILSANVFVAPLRAIAIARAAASRVTVRPSSRDPTLAQALLALARDPGIALVSDRDSSWVEAGRIDVYGRDETVAWVRSHARPGVEIRGHGAGLGVAFVTLTGGIEGSADALAADVVPFDQRGCLSPRIAVVEGPVERGEAFARTLHERLAEWGARVRRGTLAEDERADGARWRQTLAFAGTIWAGAHHAVGFVPHIPAGAPLAVPPPGRHVLVVSVPSAAEAKRLIGTIARFVVTVGTNDPTRIESVAPAHARVARLGRMQRPALDGPVDRRSL
jgi:hypothetical protein